MNPVAAVLIGVLLAAAPATSPSPSPSRAPSPPPSASARPRPARTLLGLSADLPSGASEAERTRAASEARNSGVSVFAVTVSWSECEPVPGQFRLDPILRTIRLLRQSGAAVHLDVPIVSVTQRDVPKDLVKVPFDDSRLSLRLGRFLDALEPALKDASTLSLGYGADTYFSDKPVELKAFRLLFVGAVDFLRQKVPHLRVGITTAAPTESPAPAVAAALHQESPVLFYLYAPFERENPYVHRPPDALDRDWRLLLAGAAGRPIAFPEVSYSSASENGSTPARQADFVRRLRRFVASADGSALLFARYATWRDEPGTPAAGQVEAGRKPGPAVGAAVGSPPAASIPARRAAFFAHRGLQTSRGDPKPAWLEWRRNMD